MSIIFGTPCTKGACIANASNWEHVWFPSLTYERKCRAKCEVANVIRTAYIALNFKFKIVKTQTSSVPENNTITLRLTCNPLQIIA